MLNWKYHICRWTVSIHTQLSLISNSFLFGQARANFITADTLARVIFITAAIFPNNLFHLHYAFLYNLSFALLDIIMFLPNTFGILLFTSLPYLTASYWQRMYPINMPLVACTGPVLYFSNLIQFEVNLLLIYVSACKTVHRSQIASQNTNTIM